MKIVLIIIYTLQAPGAEPQIYRLIDMDAYGTYAACMLSGEVAADNHHGVPYGFEVKRADLLCKEVDWIE